MKSLGILITAIAFFSGGLYLGLTKEKQSTANSGPAARLLPDLTLPHEDAPVVL